MDSRKGELERKRAKLAELRRQREERRRAAMQERERETTGTPSRLGSQDINDLVNSLVGDRTRSPTDRSAGSSATSPRMSIDSSGGRDRSVSAAVPVAAEDTAAPVAEFKPNEVVAPVAEFRTNEVVVADLPPKEKVLYNKETQTAEAAEDDDGAAQARLTEEEVERRVHEIREREERARSAREKEQAQREAEARAREEEGRTLTDEQRTVILESGDFAGFVEHSSRIMERALDEDYDLMVDYSLAGASDADDADGELMKLALRFHDDKITRNRSVMDLVWSRKFPELVAAAYNRNPMAPNEADGLVALWNVHLKARPEFTFHAPSDVLRVALSDFNPHIVVGGAYSGQVLVWDTRARAQPVLKTPLTATGHTHPVYALHVVGTQNAHQLISASTDGVVCSWQLDMLAQPQETLELSHPAHLRTDEVSVTCLDFADNETGSFVVGTAEGVAYQVNRYDRAGSKAGLNAFDAYRAHTAPINSLQFHASTAAEFSDLFLTTSADWTACLWRARPAAKPASTGPSDIRPLHVFDAFDDYLYDARWSPVHPAVFATADGTGRLALWNLNQDTELPIYSVTQEHALNRLAWDSHGRRVAAGGIDGAVYVYDVGEAATPRPDEHSRLARVVSELGG